MKKLSAAVLLMVLVFLLAGFAPPEKSARDNCLSVRSIKDAEVVILGDSCIVAVRTAPLFFKSDYRGVEAEIAAALREGGEYNNFYFSYDLDIFLKTAALRKKIEAGGGALQYKDDIFALISVIENRKPVIQ
jgi:hypothetical protein